MTRILKFILILFLASYPLSAQTGFDFDDSKRVKTSIPFKLINNLIIVPIIVNGVELNFLLDSGVHDTVLFSLDDKEAVSFYHVEKIQLRGLGNQEFIEGLKSSGNTLSFQHLSDKNHDLYIVLDQDFNFSSSIGIPVNGIIGYHFFKNHLVEIDYDRKRLLVLRRSSKLQKKLKKYETLPMSIELGKPYVLAGLKTDEITVPSKMLIDLGNSDAVWLFSKNGNIPRPKEHLEDFLGRGFSGDIYGTRARIAEVSLGKHAFENPIAAFPDTLSTRNLVLVENRIGSLGGEILRRFDIVFDYSEAKFYFKRGSAFDEPFNYNMSGMDVQHHGLTWVQETVELLTMAKDNTYDVNGNKTTSSFTYKFELKPVYAVSGVRKGSPADLAGIAKGDLIISINGRKSYQYTLQQINDLLKSEPGRELNILLERKEKPIQVKLRLKNLL